MATLKDYFNLHPDGLSLQYLIDRFQLTNLIETGAGRGETIEYCQPYFEKIFSIEIHPELVAWCESKFADNKNVLVFEGILPGDLGVLLDLYPIKGNCMFFHDAHFPGADFHFAKYDSEKDYGRRLPLEGELEIIKQKRDFKNDVFIIDDLWLYEDGPFQAGECTVAKELRGTGGADFIYKMFKKTHLVYKDYRWQGFLTIIPK